LQQLKNSFKLGIVSDCQVDYAIPELKILEVHDFFDSIIISGDYGFRKPDTRLFNQCLSNLWVSNNDVIFVGNDFFRDINRAKSAGLRTVLFGDQKRPFDRTLPEPEFRINRLFQLWDVIQRL
jgi:putative hydrolase of the HAD superfamily